MGQEGIPCLPLPCFWDPKIGPINGHQAVVAFVAYFLILKVDLQQGEGGQEGV